MRHDDHSNVYSLAAGMAQHLRQQQLQAGREVYSGSRPTCGNQSKCSRLAQGLATVDDAGHLAEGQKCPDSSKLGNLQV